MFLLPEPHQHDPDDPDGDDPMSDGSADGLSYLLPDRGLSGDVMDRIDPLED